MYFADKKMKVINSFLLLLFISLNTFGQDTLYLKDGIVIVCEIQEIKTNEIIYTNPGKNYPKSISLEKVEKIGSATKSLVTPEGNIDDNKFQDIISQGDSEQKEIYCMLLGMQMPFSGKVIITIDFGQERSWKPKDSMIIDKQTGKAQRFNSMIDALNYMAQKGWTFVNAYAITIGQQNVYHWLLKKEVTE